MTFSMTLIVIALASAVMLTLDTSSRLLPALGVAAGILELLAHFNVLHGNLAGLDWFLILGGALAVIGVLVWLRVTTKLTVTSATLLVAVGALQVIARL